MARREPIPARVRSLFERLGHLAVWLGFYVCGAFVLLHLLLRRDPAHWPDPRVLIAAWCTGVGVYLLDRVKLADRLLDPSDAASHPSRYRFLAARSGLVRATAVVLGAIGVVSGGSVHPALAAVVPLAFVGVWLYAGVRVLPDGRRRRRVKDVLIVKNLAVGGSITAFVFVLVLADAAHANGTGLREELVRDPIRTAWAAVFLAGHVFLDAVLCDVDDRRADARFGTHTIATRAGVFGAWWTAIVGNGVLLIAALGLRWRLELPESLRFGALMLATLVGLRLWRPTRVRDLVDLRLPACALAVALFGGP